MNLSPVVPQPLYVPVSKLPFVTWAKPTVALARKTDARHITVAPRRVVDKIIIPLSKRKQFGVTNPRRTPSTIHRRTRKYFNAGLVKNSGTFSHPWHQPVIKPGGRTGQDLTAALRRRLRQRPTA